MIVKPLYFLVSLAIGLFIVYVFHPKPEVVVKFPSPYNAGNIIYRDAHDSCYEYKAIPTSCDGNELDLPVVPQPLFENFDPNEMQSEMSSAKAEGNEITAFDRKNVYQTL
jgi:hypothetical protein